MSSNPAIPSIPALSPSQRAVLAALVEFPETTVKALAAAAGVGNSTAAATLRLLESHRLATRTVAPLEDKKPRAADLWSATANAASALMTPNVPDPVATTPSEPATTGSGTGDEPPGADDGETGCPLTIRDDDAEPEALSLCDTDGVDEDAVVMSDSVARTAVPTAVAPAEAGDRDSKPDVADEPSARLGKGVLREAVLDHLRQHPDSTFTPTALSKALTRSSGAISNALDVLVASHNAVMVCEKPRTFQAAPVAS